MGAFDQAAFAVDRTGVNVEHLASHAAELAFGLTQHIPLVGAGVSCLYRFVVGDRLRG